MPLFIDDLVSPFYETSEKGAPVFGDIYWAPIDYVHDNKEIWRPVAVDASGTVARTFTLETAGADAYRRRSPLSIPRLATNEEFPAVRAKPRPVIVVSVGPPDRGVRVARGKGAKFYQDLTIVVPVFSLEHRVTGQLKVIQAEIDRIRLLRYPEFFYLPKTAPVFDVIGVAKLARLVSIPTAHLDRGGYRLSTDARSILRDSLRWLVLGEGGETYAAYQAQLKDQ